MREQKKHPLPKAWMDAWVGATDKSPYHSGDDLTWRSPKPPKELAALRPALLAAFEASLPQFAADWKAAGERLAEGRRRYEAASDSKEANERRKGTDFWLDGISASRAVAYAFQELISCAAKLGLAQALPAALAKAKGLPDRAGFSRLLALAASGSGPWSDIKSTRDRDALCALLASGEKPVAALWRRWAAANDPKAMGLGLMFEGDLDRDELRAKGVVADLLAAAAKRPAMAAVAAALCPRVIEAARLLPDASGDSWRRLGRQVAEDLKRSYASFGPAQEPLRALFPVDFWLGARLEVGVGSKLGAWIFEGLAAEARAQPSGEIRRELGAIAWASLDRKERDAFEAAFPGASAEAIESLRERPFRSLGAAPSLDSAGYQAREAKAAWLLPAFAKAGAPVPSRRDGGGDGGDFRDWIRENPGAACDALLAANAKLEARALARAIRESGAAPAKPAKARAPRL